ncbi:hypothetical protein AQUCO_02900017v1 [Aquilegia coerulea]|uniref:Uncharacterized protein n=1 Tax=Aquilegia coerulea TaxID=218851 RepID=A0A2G5D2Y7_AQUCA|nr:hypothetical protein AQUCO_117000001v1 [Aquilegia coerulea]PIA37882.1 hypothetical protein AQUCO_02900017v1 [Aquilegia coerulea]
MQLMILRMWVTVRGNAKEMMNEFYVGELDTSTIPVKQKFTPPNQPHYNQDKTSEFIIKLLQFLVPLAFLGLDLEE